MKLHLALSGDCNLECAYCLQKGRRVRGPMSVDVADAALDLLDGVHDPPHSVTLSGGEPFLAPAIVRHVVSSLRRRSRGEEPIECVVLTNGTRVSEGDLAFLAENDAGLRVSFDGVPSAQAWRGAGTHATVTRLLGRALERHPSWARRRLSVTMVVRAVTVPTLAASVEEPLSMGVPEIRLHPLLTHDPGWTGATGHRLEEQIDRVAEVGTHPGRSTGRFPMEVLRDAPPRGRGGTGGRGTFCSASSTDSVAVDPEGRAWGCPSFMPSLQRLPLLGRSAAARLALGHVLDPGFERRLAELPRRAGRLPLLRDRDMKWSRRGRCRDCPAFEECFVCPVATTHVPGSDDPHRVPDHQCDFQYTTLKARRRRRRSPWPASVLPVPRRWVGFPAPAS